MVDVKVNLTVLLPGSTIMSKQECLKQLNEEVKDKKGHVLKDKKGNVRFRTRLVLDPEKHDCHSVRVIDKNGRPEYIPYYTRKCIPAKQVLNISTAAYLYFIHGEAPQGYHAPSNFQPYMSLKKMSAVKQAWEALPEDEKLKWHLWRTAETLGGTILDYVVYKD